jgi:endonuclease G
MRPGTAAMSQSFYLSNMIPQIPSINRGVWKKLELQVIRWVKEDRELYVITGPLVAKSATTIGDSVVVPTFMYKIIVDAKTKDTTAFVIPNFYTDGKKPHSNLSLYRYTVQDIEKIVGFNFFPKASPELNLKLITSAGKSFKLE